MDDLADFFRKVPRWGRQWTAMESEERPGPLTLELGHDRIQLAMCCPRCFRSMRLISPPLSAQHRPQLRSLSWHCEACGMQSTRRVQC